MSHSNKSTEQILRHFEQECSLYQLNPGTLTNEKNGFSNRYTYASIYFANCSIPIDLIYEYYYDKIDLLKDDVILKTKDDFKRSVILVNFALCTIVVSAWLLLIVQLLSVKAKPRILKLTTLLLAVTQTVTLVKLSELMKSQFISCYQDREEMTENILDSLDNLIPLFITQIAVFCNVIDIAKQLLSRFSLNGFFLGLHYLHIIITILDLVFFGINFFTPGNRTDSFHDWVNLGMVVTSSYCYLHLLLVYVLFVIFKSSFSFKFKNFVQIILIFLLLLFAISINIIWITKLSQNLKWILPIFLFALTATITMIYELLNNIEEFDHKVETKGIVGREIFSFGDQVQSKRNQLYSNFRYDEEEFQEEEDDDDDEEFNQRSTGINNDIESQPELINRNNHVIDIPANEIVVTGSINGHTNISVYSNNNNDDDDDEPPPAFEPDNRFEIGDNNLTEKRR